LAGVIARDKPLLLLVGGREEDKKISEMERGEKTHCFFA
jgi:hypothetical protein